MQRAVERPKISVGTLLRMEWLKLKRTPVQWLMLAGPVGMAALIVWYYAGRAATPSLAASLFEAFMQIASTMAVPLGAGILAGFVILQEELAGNFSGYLVTAVSRARLYGSKLAFMIIVMASAIVLSTLALGAGLSLFTELYIPWDILAAAASIAIVASLPLLALHLWVSLAWGMGASVAIGGAGLLIAALSATSLGDAVWPFIPWAWPVRLSILPGVYLLPDPPDQAVLSAVWGVAFQGSLSVVLSFIVLWIGGLLWFRKWEGRKTQE